MADAGAQGPQDTSLAAYQRYVRQVMSDRGFDDETVSQKFMLLLEEAGEFAQAARKNADLAQATDTAVETVNDAAADVMAILLDICNKLEVDLETAFVKREHKNQTRTWE
jgi:NTP pyrophosphatase (non-canonical NTP hydrolase)